MQSRMTWLRVAGAILVSLLLTLGGGVAALSAQEPPGPGEGWVIAVALACPDAEVEPDLLTCDTIAGVSIEVEVNGTELPGSPFTTALDSIGYNSIAFAAPLDATLTLTQVGGIPDGYVPLASSDPLVADVPDLPEFGTGGESTGPYALLVNVPVEDDAPADEDDEEPGPTTGLPDTGTGTSHGEAGWAAAWLALAAAGSMAGGLLLRRPRATS